MISLNKVKIITDSTSDLPLDIIRNNDVDVVPLYVEFGESSFKDGVEIFPEKLFRFVEEKGVLPKTASPTPYDFQSIYRKYIDLDYDIIVIVLSSLLSSTYHNAALAASEFPEGRVKVIDSRNATTGIGFLVLTACELNKKGLGSEEIKSKLEEMIPRVRVNFVIDTLEYLYKGGRCNAVQNLLGSILKVHPIITLSEGKMIVSGKVRGDKKKVFGKMLEDVNQNKNNMMYNRLIIPYSWGSEEDARILKSEILKIVPEYEVITSQVGCVISSHCGNNAIGISYCLNY